MSTRHTLVWIFALALLWSAVPARTLAVSVVPDGTWSWDEPQQTERFSKTVPLGKTGSVILTNIAGDIIVTGGTGEQVVIEAVKRGRTAEDIKAIQIEVVNSEGRVEIATKYPQGAWGGDRHNNSSVSYTLNVPKGAMVRVKSISGDIRVSAVDGELRADTVSGDVNVEQAGQLEGLKSVSGDVTVKNASSAGTLDVGSVSGNLTLWNVKARSIDGSTVSGDVTLNDVTCDRVTAKSVSGEIAFGGPLAKSGRYALQSHSGNIVVKVANKAGFEVSANSFSGDITSDLPLTARFGGTGEERRRPRRQEVRGTYGDGSAMLELTTFSGNVRIVDSAAAAAVKK